MEPVVLPPGVSAVTPPAGDGALFTCLACHVAFRNPDAQRDHYRTDWHRYNLKRKMAELRPVTAEEFATKVLAQQTKTKEEEAKAAITTDCLICNKSFSNEATLNNHLNSKKHKEMLVKAESKSSGKEKADSQPASTPSKRVAPAAAPVVSSPLSSPLPSSSSSAGASAAPVVPDIEDERKRMQAKLAELRASASNNEGGSAGEENDMTESVMDEVEARIAKGRHLEPHECIFCGVLAESFDTNLEHMTKDHGMFIPDIEYLQDLHGLVRYLADKVSIGNVCLHCNGKGRGFHSLEAVRKHMIDKGHCKILYDSNADVELLDFYDFSATYPDYVEGEERGDEEVDPMADALIINENVELILPSGARIGHRSLARYYKQNLRPTESRDSIIINRLMSQYKQLGWHGYSKTEQETVRREDRVRLRDRKRFDLDVGRRGNKLQHYFREQVLY